MLWGDEYLISKLRNVIQGTKSGFCLESLRQCTSLSVWNSFISDDSQSWGISHLLKTAG